MSSGSCKAAPLNLSSINLGNDYRCLSCWLCRAQLDREGSRRAAAAASYQAMLRASTPLPVMFTEVLWVALSKRA